MDKFKFKKPGAATSISEKSPIFSSKVFFIFLAKLILFNLFNFPKTKQIFVSIQNSLNIGLNKYEYSRFYISNNVLIFRDVIDQDLLCNVLDINGKILFQKHLSYGDKSFNLPVLNKGLYFAQIISKSSNLKVVKFIIN